MKKCRCDVLKLGAMAGAGIQGTITNLAMKFDLPTGTQICRGPSLQVRVALPLLEHEDNEMMRPMDVVG